MALNIKNERVERLAEEIARMTGETKTGAILRALEERGERIARTRSGKRRLDQVLDFLETQVWPEIPRRLLGRRITKAEREQILGYESEGV